MGTDKILAARDAGRRILGDIEDELDRLLAEGVTDEDAAVAALEQHFGEPHRNLVAELDAQLVAELVK